MKITSDVHRIDGVIGANSYLVNTDSTLVVIDTGLPGNAKRIVSYIEKLKKNSTDVSHIILTHADIDHIGSAAELKKITNAKIAIHASDASILSGKSDFKSTRGPWGKLFRLFLTLMRFHAVDPDIIFQTNSEICGFQVIHTPGHTQGSISLYIPGKLIFVGDALYKRFALDAEQARISLGMLSKLEFDILLPGHGTPIIGNASARFRDQIAQRIKKS